MQSFEKREKFYEKMLFFSVSPFSSPLESPCPAFHIHWNGEAELDLNF